MNWKLNEDEALCADGYPIRIKRGGVANYILEVDGKSLLAYYTLALAKMDAERIVAKLDEFTS